MIYLDNGATTYPKPLLVRQRLQQALTRFGANPGRGGFAMSLETAEAVYRVRKQAARFFDLSQPERVIFQPGCTQALNVVLHSLQSGDHVLVSDLEHNAVYRPLKALEKQGVRFTVVPISPGADEATLDAFRKAWQENTRLVVCNHASNVWGIRAPVERLAALAHIYGAKICVDAAQTAGVLPLSVDGSGFDYVCCAGHKGLYGPMGVGLLLLGKGISLYSLVQGGTGTQALEITQPASWPEGLESGTQNIPGILALGAGLEFLRQVGEERIRQKEMRHTQRLYDGLAAIKGVKLYTQRPTEKDFAPVLSFTVETLPSERVGTFLAERDIAVRCGYHCAPYAHQKMGTTQSGAVRMMPSWFTTDAQIAETLRAVRALVQRFGAKKEG